MKSYQPLLLEALHIRVGPVAIRRLRLNRHSSETSTVRHHQHAHSQLLIYLSGQGAQLAADSSRPIRSGTAALFPPGLPHAFRPLGARRPICLVIDFDFRGAARHFHWIGPLPQAELGEIRRSLSALIRLRGNDHRGVELQSASLVLGILHRALQSGGWLPKPPALRSAGSEVVRRTQRLLENPVASAASVTELARTLGYQKDYLNRLLRQAGGLTLGQLRSAQRLERAKRSLLQGKRVHQVAAEVGWNDANYFTRWFHKQTGMAPLRWRVRAERSTKIGTGIASSVPAQDH